MVADSFARVKRGYLVSAGLFRLAFVFRQFRTIVYMRLCFCEDRFFLVARGMRPFARRMSVE